ncbi:nucleoside triphosphate pyrophosphohydrolase [Altererythrobacter sp. SALINAS58]|uniref:nucleoside triphosphate pyrophosphohydrolase n=1 Tax=Alteripontixanthobacter muriae TaxID=2705546 RepID=UPI001575A900|nr:nucleoside triphosphate pyrophosphohydrolase [Alteripontixanthobacter muriae]NTZ41667.1 nucleoside triphosphate pyrophosphohydrolase [Alteripontixanthobacter muriae]
MTDQFARLLQIMRRLRDPLSGCEWDRAQTFATIAPYTIEEAYEVSDAIDRNDDDDLKEELGDLLLQVVFQSQIAEEAGLFDIQDVARTIADKMEARHPHIFSDATAAEVESRWEQLKEHERHAKGEQSAMDGVALALPGLLRAEKLQKRAAREGFDWADRSGAESKILEEMQELRQSSAADREEEAGDLLFSAVNLVRKYGVDPEVAMRKANAKFERRYRVMEAMAETTYGSGLSPLDDAEMDSLWRAAKAQEL